MVEYFSTTRWDGAVDLSWYNGTDTEFSLTTPAQLAGVAELEAILRKRQKEAT